MFTLPLLLLTMAANCKLLAFKGLTNNDAVDFDSLWAVLSSSLREIHTRNASKLSFEELYRTAYKLVLKKKGELLYIKVKEFEQDWLSDEIRPRIFGTISSSLLLGTISTTAITTTNEKRVAGERLMKALKEAWEDHNLCMNMTTDVLMYMVGHFWHSLFWKSSRRANNESTRTGYIVLITDSLRSSPRRWDSFVILFFEVPYRHTMT